MDVETTAYRAFSSPFDFSYTGAGSTDSSSAYSSTSGSSSSGTGSGSRLLDQFSPDTLSSIWSSVSSIAGVADASKEANHEMPVFSENDGPSVDSTLADDKIPAAMTGRESSSPLSAGGASSVASSLKTSALDNLTTASLFGDSVWSSKGSFTDLGSFGSTEEERRYLAEGAVTQAKGYLKPPGSAPGSNSSATWGSFWSDLSPSLSPSNSETNLQHFGSSPSALGNPFATWTASTAGTANRRAAPANSSSSPFSSGSVSPINRKPLSPNVSIQSVQQQQQPPFNRAYAHQQQQQQQQQNSQFNSHVRHQQYRRSASHPNNGHLLHHHNHQANHQYYGLNNGFDSTSGAGNFYSGSPHESAFSGGWNMEPATSINGYHQQQENRNYSSPGGTTMIGMDSMKYGFDTQMNDVMRDNAWDDNGKGKSFFGTYASYDGSRAGYSDPLLDPFDQMVPASISPLASRMSPRNQSSSDFGNEHMHVFSRKVFVGGLPPDIDEEEITTSFRRFGPLIVDWPHKAESKSYFPPKGYAFLLFQDESSVQTLMDASVQEGDKTYYYVSSPTNKDKPVQVRPWRLTDNECYLDAQSKLDPRLTVFVGGVPRPLRAQELAVLMNQRFGYVAYAGIDVDSELKYPKGAGRITFSNQQSYIAAINARFVQLQNGEIDKRVELKPYVLDDQICDYCHGMKCSGRSAPLFCSQVGCLAYLCEHCWTPHHSSPGKEHHKPVTKESSVDRSRPAAMRW